MRIVKLLLSNENRATNMVALYFITIKLRIVEIKRLLAYIFLLHY